MNTAAALKKSISAGLALIRKENFPGFPSGFRVWGSAATADSELLTSSSNWIGPVRTDR